MIITDDFVFIHYPKTGGTFVTDVLKRLYQYKKRYRYLNTVLPKRIQNKVLSFAEIRKRIQGFIHTKNHGTCHEIPERHRNKPILATVRNPYDRYVSTYKFEWWKKYPEEDFEIYTVEELKNKCPNFPDLSFEEYIYLWNSIWLPEKIKYLNVQSKESFGLETFDFVNFFFKNPQQVLSDIYQNYEDYVSAERYRSDMFKTHFLRTDHLNQDLYNFLLSIGWDKDQILFILDLPKHYPKEGGRSAEQKWEKYYTPELKSTIKQKERLIFEIFPEFNL